MLILGISGKKQSGKTTSGNFIASVFMTNLGISQKIQIDSTGQLIISDLFGNQSYKGLFDLLKPHTGDFLKQKAIDTLNPYVKLYSFADPLKLDICINILGLTWDQCYGSDEHKNSLTSLLWQDMPGNHKRTGYMTAREVMEHVGTNIFRQIKKDSWVAATIKKIMVDKPKLAIITDCRFPDEIAAIKQHSGKVIRLSRSPFESTHESELVLDENKYDWNNFDYIIRNNNMEIYDQCLELQKILQELVI